MSLTAAIRRKARELGFEPVGFTPAEPLEAAALYARWVALGFAGEMDYLKRNLDKRANPATLVPGAKTVICLGMAYYQKTPASTDPLTGRIACYARGDDYHDLVKKRLFALWDWIQQATGGEARGRAYVDTAPLLERALAQRAGLGWQGKNTCLINQRQGSFFFLGEIVLNLELECDEPAVDHCGTCTRCLQACPTDAFSAPYVLDARRCLAYLTIELKGAIPRELRAEAYNWIFGCDICQDVCPWNRRAQPAAEMAFQPRPGLEAPSLPGLLELDQPQFRETFRRSPVKRPKRAGLRRNVAVALGNSKSRAAAPSLIRALADRDPLVREHAAWALGRIGGKEARVALAQALEGERHTAVREEIQQALKELN